MVEQNLAEDQTTQEPVITEESAAQPTTEETEKAKPEEAKDEESKTSEDEGQEAKADEETEHRKRDAKSRIEQLARQKNEIKRDRDYWRERALNSEGSRKELAEHEAEKLEAQEVKINHQEWEAKLSHARDVYPDFVDVVSTSTAIVNKSVEKAVLESDNATDILYHLAKNPSDVERLNQMSERQLSKEILRFELKYESVQKPEVKETPKPKVSSAPEPIKPASSNRGVVHKDPNQMSMSEYTEWRRSQGATF